MHKQFLSHEEILRYKKGACVFCNEELETKLVKEERKVLTSRTDFHSDSYNILERKYLVSDLEIYTFQVSLKNKLDIKKENFIKKIREGRQDYYQDKLKDLEVSEEERLVLESTMVNYSFYQLRDCGKLTLEQNVEKLFYGLELHDFLSIQHSIYERKKGETWGIDFIDEYFFPVGIKSHKKCWPFLNFDKQISFNVTMNRFLKSLKTNLRFADYVSFCAEDIYSLTKNTKVQIDAKEYNPFECVGD